MTYNVFGGTLNLTQLQLMFVLILLFVTDVSVNPS